MSQEIEIEFKSMLTKEEFYLLRQQLPFPERPIIQVNHYFETKQFSLKKYKSALRIREKEAQYRLTLKEPYGENILETHDRLTKSEATNWLTGRPSKQSNVSRRLQSLGIDEANLHYYGSLTTERYIYTNSAIDYMLDKSSYHGINDYELEIEATSREKGLQALQDLLSKFNIVERKAKPKIARFFEATL